MPAAISCSFLHRDGLHGKQKDEAYAWQKTAKVSPLKLMISLLNTPWPQVF